MLRSRVFISCGQSSPRDVKIAQSIARLFKGRGFDPYVAKEVQSVFEINSGIIGELKNSDCYLFVNFRRERMRPKEFRGSLFSNQEFAIAYALGFDRIIVVNEKGVKSEVMLRYIGCNTETFTSADECLAVVKDALRCSGWKSGYSRRLRAENVRFVGNPFRNFVGELMEGRFLSLDIANGRPDLAALETSCRLVGFRADGEQDWVSPSELHRSLLKASKRSGFAHTVFPRSSETFNILFMGSVSSPGHGCRDGVYLNSALDFVPNQPLPIEPGHWHLLYEFCAIGFPLLRVDVSLRYSTFDDATADLLRQYTATT